MPEQITSKYSRFEFCFDKNAPTSILTEVQIQSLEMQLFVLEDFQLRSEQILLQWEVFRLTVPTSLPNLELLLRCL